ncbi:MAG: response regulator transcription factor [Thermomicrobiales bacterium]
MIGGTPAMSILLVDDETRLRRAIARSLTARGYRVDEAATCREAVAAASSGRYDLLLLDVNLPDATGWDALRELAAAGRTIPTVMVSAVPPSASRVREFQPVGVLHKPFPIDALLRLVQSVATREGAEGAGPDVEPNEHE